MRSGESTSSPYVCLPCSRSRTTSSDHLSPTMSSELAIAQAERVKGLVELMIRFSTDLKSQSDGFRSRSDLQSASKFATVPYNLQNASLCTRSAQWQPRSFRAPSSLSLPG